MAGEVLALLQAQETLAIAHVLEIGGETHAFTDSADWSTISGVWTGSRTFLPALGLEGTTIDRSLSVVRPSLDVPSIQVQLNDVDDATIVDLFADAHQDALLTYLTADLDRDDTTITVKSTALFPASGTLHIGHERITYTGKT